MEETTKGLQQRMDQQAAVVEQFKVELAALKRQLRMLMAAGVLTLAILGLLIGGDLALQSSASTTAPPPTVAAPTTIPEPTATAVLPNTTTNPNPVAVSTMTAAPDPAVVPTTKP